MNASGIVEVAIQAAVDEICTRCSVEIVLFTVGDDTMLCCDCGAVAALA